MNCPDCNRELLKVHKPFDSCLNEEQFQSVRAGDWYCPICKGSRGKTSCRYFWDRELKEITK